MKFLGKKASLMNRKLHRQGAWLVLVPLLIMTVTGILLMFKKESAWIQPPTQKGSGKELNLSFPEILETAQKVLPAEINDWTDIDRLDVRPGKNVIKVRAVNRWEIQMDASDGSILAASYRRSDLIESIHDGSFFHYFVKMGLFLPASLILLGLWFSGLYLLLYPKLRALKKKRQEPNKVITLGAVRREKKAEV